MKRILFNIAGLLAIIQFAGCDKNELSTREFTSAGGQSYLKVNIFSFKRSNPLMQIKINDTRVSNSLIAATPFPGGGLNTGGSNTSDYLSVKPGDTKVAISLPKAGTNTDSVELINVNSTLEAEKNYSLYFADTAANMTSLLVVDSLNRPDSGFAKYKFVNLMPDIPALDLYIGTVKVASNIAYKAVSPSFVIPTNNASTTWAIRAAGGTSNLATYASAASIGNQRVYTVVGRGYSTISATTDPRRRLVSLIYNK